MSAPSDLPPAPRLNFRPRQAPTELQNDTQFGSVPKRPMANCKTFRYQTKQADCRGLDGGLRTSSSVDSRQEKPRRYVHGARTTIDD